MGEFIGASRGFIVRSFARIRRVWFIFLISNLDGCLLSPSLNAILHALQKEKRKMITPPRRGGLIITEVDLGHGSPAQDAEGAMGESFVVDFASARDIEESRIWG